MIQQFKIEGEYIELVKLLKASGLCATGGMAKVVIDQGQVDVDGQVEFRKRCKIRPGQVVTHAGMRVEIK